MFFKPNIPPGQNDPRTELVWQKIWGGCSMGVEQRFFCDMFIIAESLRPVSFRWKEFELLLFFSQMKMLNGSKWPEQNLRVNILWLTVCLSDCQNVCLSVCLSDWLSGFYEGSNILAFVKVVFQNKNIKWPQ